MDSVSLAIAATPLALYLIGLGAVNLRRRPVVVSNIQDVVTLALAVSGLLVVGPMNLFLPDAAVARLGAYVWLLLVALVSLCVTLYLLVSRPRLVILNLPKERIGDVLQRVSSTLDSAARVSGNSVHLPEAGVQFNVEPAPTTRSVSLIASADDQSYSGWKRLQQELARLVKDVEVTPNPHGFTLVSIGVLLIGWPAAQLLQTPADLIAQRLSDMLRL